MPENNDVGGLGELDDTKDPQSGAGAGEIGKGGGKLPTGKGRVQQVGKLPRSALGPPLDPGPVGTPTEE